MKKYRIVQKLDSDKKFYYIVQQRKYIFFWGLLNWRKSLHLYFIETFDGLAAPPDYTYKRFTYVDLDEVRTQIKKITNSERKPTDHHNVIEYL
jgi:hypothetical protein